MSDPFPLQTLLEMRQSERESAVLALSHAAVALQEARATLERATAEVRRLQAAINDQRTAPQPLDPTEAWHITDYLRALETELLDARDAVQTKQTTAHEAERVAAEYRQDLQLCDAALEATKAERVSWQAGRDERRERREVTDAEEIAASRWQRKQS